MSGHHRDYQIVRINSTTQISHTIREFEKDPGMEGEATELAPASRVEIPVAGFAASDRTVSAPSRL